VESHIPHYPIHLIIHLCQNAFEVCHHISEEFVVWVTFASVFDDTFEESLVSSYPESRLTQLIVSYFISIVSVPTTNFTHLLITFLQILQTLLSNLCVQNIVFV
jgi:hypothetical protein